MAWSLGGPASSPHTVGKLFGWPQPIRSLSCCSFNAGFKEDKIKKGKYSFLELFVRGMDIGLFEIDLFKVIVYWLCSRTVNSEIETT